MGKCIQGSGILIDGVFSDEYRTGTCIHRAVSSGEMHTTSIVELWVQRVVSSGDMPSASKLKDTFSC